MASTVGGGHAVGRRARLALIVALATFAVFAPALRNGFVRYDDTNQITGNPLIAGGGAARGLLWAFTSFEHGNWHPLTWVSHLVTSTLFGLNPAGFHLASLLYHGAAAAVLFLVLERYTGRLMPSALAALLFSLHPLRVESVAWAAEVKDPLSGLFFLLALLAYRRFVARPGLRTYLPVALAGACALMAKPTAVVLPALLLLLDWWPLGRFAPGSTPRAVAVRLAAEKLPLAALSLAATVLTLHAQSLAGAVRSYEHPLWVRLGNAAVSLVAYLGKTLWPLRLSYFYPHPGAGISPVAIGLSVLVLAAASALALRTRRSHPYCAAGWLWYLIAAVPVSGIIQAGHQAMADRYTYLPLIGVAAAASFALFDRSVIRAAAPAARWAAAAAVLACLAALTPPQIALWRDSRTLFGHALALDPDNWNARLKLGEAALADGDSGGAVGHLRRAVEFQPGNIQARTLLGAALGDSGETDAAIEELQTAVRLNRWWTDAYFYLGIALLRADRLDEAEAAFRREAALNRANPRSLVYLGFCDLRRGDLAGAARFASTFLEREPGSPKGHYLDGLVREARGDRREAAEAYRRALILDPSLPGARAALERVEAGQTR